MNKEYLDPDYTEQLLANAEVRARNMFTTGGIESIVLPTAEKAISVLEKIKKRDCRDFRQRIKNLRVEVRENRKKLNITPNLDDKTQVKERLLQYIASSADKQYTGFGFDIEDVQDIERVGDFRFNVFPKDSKKESRIVVYDVLTRNEAQAFATLGGLLYPEQTTEHLFGKNTEFQTQPENVAKMHLYRDAELFGRELHKQGIGHKKLAKSLEIPSYLQ